MQNDYFSSTNAYFEEPFQKMLSFVVIMMTNNNIVLYWRSFQIVFRLEDAQLLHFINNAEYQYTR
jgi:hypothetical protein